MPTGAINIPLDDLGREIEALAAPAQTIDYKPLLRDFGVYLSGAAKRRFDTATAPDGAPWLPLRFGRPRGGDKPLRDRGILMAAMGAQAGGAGGAVYRLTDRSIEQGTNLDYAGTHQEGATIYPTNAKALSIPVSREAYRAGSARNFGRPLTLVWPKGKSFGWLMEPKGKGQHERTELHYLLFPKVTIPARPFAGINDEDADKMGLFTADFLERRLTA